MVVSHGTPRPSCKAEAVGIQTRNIPWTLPWHVCDPRTTPGPYYCRYPVLRRRYWASLCHIASINGHNHNHPVPRNTQHNRSTRNSAFTDAKTRLAHSAHRWQQNRQKFLWDRLQTDARRVWRLVCECGRPSVRDVTKISANEREVGACYPSCSIFWTILWGRRVFSCGCRGGNSVITIIYANPLWRTAFLSNKNSIYRYSTHYTVPRSADRLVYRVTSENFGQSRSFFLVK